MAISGEFHFWACPEAEWRDELLKIKAGGISTRGVSWRQVAQRRFLRNGRPFEIGLRRYGPAAFQEGLVLKILPLRETAPIYLTDPSKLKYGDNHTALSLDGVEVIETREVRLEAVK